ncbi:MAG: hypothetical protein GVY31_01705 [Alphaproteobacteria bacterium]|jgi:hypothetical protein|nr:hypothetical protein [Alphaproteobacteria bacterium]
MTDQLAIPAGSIRAVWVFELDLAETDLPGFRGDAAPRGPDRLSPLEQAVGAGPLESSHVELFMADTLSEYGLAKYLTEANGMDAASVAPDAERLDALSGPVLLVFSGALGAGIDRLDPEPPLRLVGRYAETMNFTLRPPLRAETAHATTAEAPARRPSDAAVSGRIAGLALLVLFLLVAVMIWVGA